MTGGESIWRDRHSKKLLKRFLSLVKLSIMFLILSFSRINMLDYYVPYIPVVK